MSNTADPLTEIALTSIAVLLRIFSNPFANVFQKQLTTKGYHPLLVNFLTYLFLSIVCVFFAVGIRWQDLPAQFWLYSVLGGIAGGVGNGFLVKAIKAGELSVLGPINSYKSVVGIIIGFFLLGEVPNVWGLLGIATIIYGSYVVLDTTEDKFSWALLRRKEIQYRIWAMILTGIEAVFVKKVILASSTLASFISWCWFGTLFSLLFLFIERKNLNRPSKQISRKEVTKFLYLVICIGTMQYTTTYTLEHIPVGYALSLFQLSAIVSVWLGYQFFKEQEIRKKLIGSAIMIIGSIIIILLKNR